MVEFQLWLPPDSKVKITCTADCDADGNPPNNYNIVSISTQTDDLRFKYDDRTGEHQGEAIDPGVISANRWYHVCMQDSAEDDIVRVYLNGELRAEDVAVPLSNLDSVQISLQGSGVPVLREFNVRSTAVYPEIPYVPGPVTFASSLGDTQKRWNSMML
jgi:hypothetical protein